MLFFTIFILFSYSSLSANESTINIYTNNTLILKNSQVYFDKNSENNISEMIEVNEKFTPVLNDFLNYGYVFKDTIWIRFTIENNSDKETIKHLIYNNPNTDIVNLHFYKDNKQHIYKGGILNREAFNSELSFNFPIALKAYETQTYYLEVKSITHSLHFDLKIQDYQTYKNSELHHQLILVFFFGALFVIIIYNGVVFINSKNIVYLYYALFIGSLFHHHLSLSGMVAYLLPIDPYIYKIQSYMQTYNMFIALTFMFIFVRKFLNFHLYKKIDFVLKFLYLIIVIIVLLHSKDFYLLQAMVFGVILFILYLEFVGLYLFVKTKEEHAKYFFMIWSISMMGIIGTALYYANILPTLVPYLFEATIFTEALLFSIILANQINNLQKEKLLLSLEVAEQKEQELEKNKIIQEQAKLASMGEMLRNIAHQWRQPLSEINSIAMLIETTFMKKEMNQKNLDSNLEKIENLTSHMSQTIEDFSSYFKSDKEPEEFHLEDAINKSLKLLDSKIKNNNIKIILDLEKNLLITTYLKELVQTLLIILNNAIDALEEHDINNRIVNISTVENEGHYIIIVEDNGNGIEENIIDKIFEPYFTTKSESTGTGIGLYMSKMIIEESMKGTLSVQNTNTGVKFIITL